MSPSHPYTGRSAALATMHGKLPLIAPTFGEQVNLQVINVSINTDAFGTFTGDIARTMTPIATAEAKAREAMERSGLQLGLASEGSIGTDAVIGFLVLDTELLVLVDDQRGIVISEAFSSHDIVAGSFSPDSDRSIEDFLTRVDFPNHGLIVKTVGGSTSCAVQGITDRSELNQVIAQMRDSRRYEQLIVESDLRAHYSPSRRRNIRQAAHRLAARVGRLCPNCSCPGWGTTQTIFGLPCRWCGTTCQSVPRAHIWGCYACDHLWVKELDDEFSDPKHCPACNP